MIVELVESSRIPDCLAPDVAVLLLTQIHYKSGEVWDMNEITHRAHEAGTLLIWDLSHSSGVIPVELD